MSAFMQWCSTIVLIIALFLGSWEWGVPFTAQRAREALPELEMVDGEGECGKWVGGEEGNVLVQSCVLDWEGKEFGGKSFEDVKDVLQDLGSIGGGGKEMLNEEGGAGGGWLGSMVKEVLDGKWGEGGDVGKLLDQFHHYHARVPMDGGEFCVVHFAWEGKGVGGVPVVALHGWPGSVWEFLPAVQRLRQEKNEGVGEGGREMVIPSLPGFGYSYCSSKVEINAMTAAKSVERLMGALFQAEPVVLQGGDWGGIVAVLIAQRTPELIHHLHLNFFPRFPLRPSSLFSSLYDAWRNPESQNAAALRRFPHILTESGYIHLQAVDPSALSLIIAPTPPKTPHTSTSAGVEFLHTLAWIGDKFIRWSGAKARHALLQPQSPQRQQLLLNILWYLNSRSLSSSIHFYRNTLQSLAFWKSYAFHSIRLSTPLTLLDTPEEPFLHIPFAWGAETTAASPSTITYQEPTTGGHFFAWEEPEQFLQCAVHHVASPQCQ